MELKREHSVYEFLLKCAICYDNFNSYGQSPKIFPCGHTICERCIGYIKNCCKDSPDNSYISYNSQSALSEDSDSDSEKKEKKNRRNHRRLNSYGSEADEGDDCGEHSEEEDNEQEDDDGEEDDLGDEVSSYDHNDIIENLNVENNGDENGNGIKDPSNDASKINKKIKIKCPTCRKKYKIDPKNLVLNSQVLSYINQKLAQEPKQEDPNDNIRVYCILCKKVDINKNHKQSYPHHENNLRLLNDESFGKLGKTFDSFETLEEMRKNTKVDDLKTYLNLNFDTLLTHRQYLEPVAISYLNTYSQIYDRGFPVFLEHDTKVFKLDYKLTGKIEARQYSKVSKKMELLRKEVFDEHIDHYSRGLLVKNTILSNKSSSLVKKTFARFLEESFATINRSIINETAKYEKRFTIHSMNNNIVFIYDLRVKILYKLSYKSIFKNFEPKMKQNEGYDYDMTKNYTEILEINDAGDQILMLGKKDTMSKKFRVYDLKNKAVIQKKDILKCKYFDMDKFYYSGYLFIFGGCNENSKAIKTVQVFKFDEDEWFLLPSLKLEKFNKTISLINNRFYLYGGKPGENSNRNNQESPNLPYKFETIGFDELLDSSGSWEILTIKGYHSLAYYPLSTFINPDALLILGGIDTENDDYVNKGYLIDVKKAEVIQDFNLKRSFNFSDNSSFYRGNLANTDFQDGYDSEDDDPDENFEIIFIQVDDLLERHKLNPYH